MLDGAASNSDNANWATGATVDNLCLGNGYLPSDGTQGAYLVYRFMLGPFGSLHQWAMQARTGPDHGIASVSLASIPEDDASSGYADPTGILKDISALTFIPLAGGFDAYSAGVVRNVAHFVPGQLVRVMGQVGDPFTTVTNDPFSSDYFIDGGPGPYALKLSLDTKAGASTGYKFDLQALHRKRVDWAFG